LARRFRWLLADARNRDKLLEVIESTHRPNYANRLQAVTELAAARGIELSECVKPCGFGGIMRAAAPAMNLKPEGAEATWRMLSGMTHGDSWATLGLGEQERLASEAVGVLSYRLTTSLDRLASFCQVVAGCLGTAYELFQQRRQAQFGA
jgi:hypothetical protein